MNPDILIDLKCVRDHHDRLYVSAGTRFIHEYDQDDYQESAVVPNQPWKSIQNDVFESTDLLSPESIYHRAIWLVDLSTHEDIIRFSQTTLRSVRRQADVTCIESTEYQMAIDSILKATEQFRLKNEFSLAGISVNPPNLETVTRNMRTGKRTGLHIDSWDCKALNSRALCSNRICINLSANDRWFLFYPISVERIYAHMLQAVSTDLNLHEALLPTTLPVFVTDLYPLWPIYRLRIRPFEAYIAPTENLIHDGSSLNSLTADISMTVRGFFGVRTYL